MKIAAFEVEPWECEMFRSLEGANPVQCCPDTLNPQNASDFRGAEILSIFIYSLLSAEVLRELPEVKLIATRSTGFDHIDMDYCRQRKITVSNVPVYGSHTVAEHVFGLILTISHKLVESIDRTRKGDFSLKGLRGFDLQGKTLGVIGAGLIGQHVIQIARGFGMNVVAFDAKPDPSLAKRLGLQYAGLDELLSRADIITLHVPATRQTRNLISHEQFAKMKDGAVLINTARGSIVDVEALLQAIARGKVSAAGLDVLPEEPVIREEAELLSSFFHRKHDMSAILAGHILLRMRNVYITPHNAFNTREAIERIMETTIENIEAFLAGEPRNLVGN